MSRMFLNVFKCQNTFEFLCFIFLKELTKRIHLNCLQYE